jgi:squalene cyclase
MTHAHRQESAASVRRALTFLLKMQRPDGLWSDFYTLAGQSNHWVSAVVGCALTRGIIGSDGGSVDRALAELAKEQRSHGGWAYNRKVPGDCDSTAWVLQFMLRRSWPKSSSLFRATRYVLRHQDPDSGGFSTYAPPDRIERFIGVRPEQTQGWLAPHLGVSCTSVEALIEAGADCRAPRMAKALRYIAAQRPPGGLWSCYWWCGHGYATYHALRALSLGNEIDKQTVAEVSNAILERQAADGTWGTQGTSSVFETAEMLRALHLIAHREQALASPIRKARLALLERQKNDGSFEPTPMLRIPPPHVADPGTVAAWRIDRPGTGVLISDSERVYTTASAISALCMPCWQGQ